jgi:hypothetical protein
VIIISTLKLFTPGATLQLRYAISQLPLNVWEVSGDNASITALRFDPNGVDPAPLVILNEDNIAKFEQVDVMDGPLRQFELEFGNLAAL